MKEILKPYQKEFAYSYTSGAYATIELLRERPELTEAVYLHSDCAQPELMEALCARHSIPVLRSDAAFTRINQKENSYVLGVFRMIDMRGMGMVIIVRGGLRHRQWRQHERCSAKQGAGEGSGRHRKHP